MENKCFIRLMGDVMIGRLVNEKIREEGYDYPWGDVLPYLKNPGVNIINLETTLTTSIKREPKVFNFKADPDKVKTLADTNIHIANIANNHILDFSEQGLLETIKMLDIAKIQHTGAGKNITIVDDGIATGSTIVPALKLCRARKVSKVIVASPVSGERYVPEIGELADEVKVVEVPDDFYAVGQVYEDFHGLSDREVIDLLHDFEKYKVSKA